MSCRLLSLVVFVEVTSGHPRPSSAEAPVNRGCPAWTHLCAPESRMTLRQRAPFLVWLLFVLGVVTSCVLCAREVSRVLRDVLTTGCISCATENTYTTHRVSPYLADPEMNWTSSFLLQSDKLGIVPHLPLAPGGTVGKPAEHESGHRPRPSPARIAGRSYARLMEKIVV